MNWSISTSRMFKRCPRKWFFHQVVSDARSDDELRKEASYLKTLQTIPAWRGTLVDYVISSYAVPRMNKKEKLEPEELVTYGLQLANSQIQYAVNSQDKASYLRNGSYSLDGEVESEEGFKKTHPYFFDLEYREGLESKRIDQAKLEVKQSLLNFAHSQFLKEFYQDGTYAISQRTLRFSQDGLTVSSTPDIIAFFDSLPPSIIDWKVQASAHTEHWQQLALYALVLSRVNPHRDFPTRWSNELSDPKKIRLVEVQLLQKYERMYNLEESDIIDLENFIYYSSSRMKNLLKDRDYPEIIPSQIPTTMNPNMCRSCGFRRICWEKAEAN